MEMKAAANCGGSKEGPGQGNRGFHGQDFQSVQEVRG